jgi:hypothetical protein
MTAPVAPQLALRAYQCLHAACGAAFQAAPSDRVTCTKCGRANVKRVRLAAASPQTASKAPVAPPPVAVPAAKGIPSAPKPPAMPAKPVAKPGVAPKGPVPSLAQQLQQSKVGVFDAKSGARTINRDQLDRNAYDRAWNLADQSLPEQLAAPSAQAEVASLIRHVVNGVQQKQITDVTLSFLLHIPFKGGMQSLTLANRVTVDLSLPLTEMARGVCRPLEHANANSTFGNHARILPEYVQGERVHDLEFGWRYPLPQNAFYTTRSRKRALRLVGMDEGTGIFAAARVATSGDTVDAGLRLVISEWGYLFLTTDHYRSFRMYDPVHEKWVAYGETKNASASWYNRGEDDSSWMLPVSAPRYW